MENSFIIDTNDNGLSIKFKTEANIKLASVKNKEKREEAGNCFASVER